MGSGVMRPDIHNPTELAEGLLLELNRRVDTKARRSESASTPCLLGENHSALTSAQVDAFQAAVFPPKSAKETPLTYAAVHSALTALVNSVKAGGELNKWDAYFFNGGDDPSICNEPDIGFIDTDYLLPVSKRVALVPVCNALVESELALDRTPSPVTAVDFGGGFGAGSAPAGGAGAGTRPSFSDAASSAVRVAAGEASQAVALLAQAEGYVVASHTLAAVDKEKDVIPVRKNKAATMVGRPASDAVLTTLINLGVKVVETKKLGGIGKVGKALDCRDVDSANKTLLVELLNTYKTALRLEGQGDAHKVAASLTAARSEMPELSTVSTCMDVAKRVDMAVMAYASQHDSDKTGKSSNKEAGYLRLRVLQHTMADAVALQATDPTGARACMYMGLDMVSQELKGTMRAPQSVSKLAEYLGVKVSALKDGRFATQIAANPPTGDLSSLMQTIKVRNALCVTLLSRLDELKLTVEQAVSRVDKMMAMPLKDYTEDLGAEMIKALISGGPSGVDSEAFGILAAAVEESTPCCVTPLEERSAHGSPRGS